MKRILLLALLFACGPALAQGTGWYIGGGLGSTKADFVSGDFSPFLESGPYTADDSDVAPRIFGGGYAGGAWTLG